MSAKLAGIIPAAGTAMMRQLLDIDNAIAEMKSRLSGAGPFSLCEARLDESTYVKLGRWIQERLTWPMITTARWKAGALTLHFIAETARREAQEGHVWSAVRDKFAPDVARRLFAGGQPTAAFKELLVDAAQQMNLRHVFDRDDTQNWYQTTYLQFGFTLKGMQAHLPAWLVGQGIPVAVQHLLSGPLASRTFSNLWEALRYYRRDWITLQQLAQVLENNPWILPAWKDELIRLARERRDLDDELLEDEASRAIVDAPNCSWDPVKGITFTSSLEGLGHLGLIASHYHLRINGEVTATVFRQLDGRYRGDPAFVSWSLKRPQNHVELVGPDGEVRFSQLVELWDPTADINVFDLSSGKRVEDTTSAVLTPQRSYVLLAAHDLVINPPQADWHRLGKTLPKATLLRAPWDSDLEVVSPEGYALWHPTLRKSNEIVREPSWAASVRITLDGVSRMARVGQSVRPVIHGLPANATLAYVRCGGQPVRFNAQNGIVERMVVTPELAQSNNGFLLGIRLANGGACPHYVQLTRNIDLDIVGSAKLDQAGWQSLDPGFVMAASEGRECAYRVFLPRDSSGQRAALMEGSVFLRWIDHRPGPIANLPGLGAPLVVREQPYNCVGQLVKLASAVTDGGLITQVRMRDSSGDYEIVLARPLVPGETHRVICWSPGSDNQMETIGPSDLQVDHDGASWLISGGFAAASGNKIFGLSYAGHWLGSGWTGDLEEMFERLPEASNALLLAAMTRWFQLPVLLRNRPQERPMFSMFARKHAAALLTAWFTNRGLPETLHTNDSFQRREFEAAEIRELFMGWVPDVAATEQIVRCLGEQNSANPFEETVRLLAEVHPLLTGHLMVRWLHEINPQKKDALKSYVQRLRYFALHPSAQRAAEADPLEQAAATMRVDPRSNADSYFVKHAIADPAIGTLRGEELSHDQQSNLSVALQIGSFRRYLATRVFDELAGLPRNYER